MKILDNGVAVLEGDSHISKWIEETGKLAHDETIPLYILPLIKEGDWIVEGGSNLGTHTVAYANTIKATGRIFAFEPNPPVFECLVKNTREYPNIYLYRYALSNRETAEFLYGQENAGASYVSPEDHPDKTFTVHCMPLDKVNIERVDFIKLDIEGYELLALHGAVMTLIKHRPTMLIEMNRIALSRNGHTYDHIMRFLRGLNYEYRPLTPDLHLDDEQYDLLVTPK